jgi:hypothetical protein
MSKAQIKKAIAIGEAVHTKFMDIATRQGTTKVVNGILEENTNWAWAFIEEFGVGGIFVDGGEVVSWKGMTKEQLKHQVNIAFIKTSNKK